MKHLIWLLLTTLIVVPVVAAVDCPAIVESALETTDALCETTRRNQACYGHVSLEAEPQPGVEDFDFDEPGEREDVTALQSLRLSPMQLDSGVWGVAMMRLQASLPSSQREDITLLMFGNVEIQNAVQTPPVVLDVTVSVDEYINVRRLPSTRAGVMGVLAPGQTVRALERLENGTWLRVEIPDSGVIGWLDASLVTSEADLSTLAVSEPWTPRYRPMQAFYFKSGENEPGCGEAPTSGMLIQTPEGVGQVTLLINEVSVRIGSTAFFEAQPGQEMRVSTVEGAVEVEAMGVTHTAVAGSEVSVPLDDHNEPAAPPSPPRPYNQAQMQALPVAALEQVVAIPAPLTEEQIEEIVATDEAANVTPTNQTTATTSAGATGEPASTGSVSVESVCVGEWVVRNSTAHDVSFTWDAVGNGASGGGIALAGGEATFSANANAVSISYDLGSGPHTSGASSNGLPCGEAPVVEPTVEASPSVAPPPDKPTDDADEPTDVPPTAAPPTEATTDEPTQPPSPEPTTQSAPVSQSSSGGAATNPPTGESPTPAATATP